MTDRSWQGVKTFFGVGSSLEILVKQPPQVNEHNLFLLLLLLFLLFLLFSRLLLISQEEVKVLISHLKFSSGLDPKILSKSLEKKKKKNNNNNNNNNNNRTHYLTCG